MTRFLHQDNIGQNAVNVDVITSTGGEGTLEFLIFKVFIRFNMAIMGI